MFKNLRGNAGALKRLERYARDGAAGFSLILAGPHGVGKRRAALAFAEARRADVIVLRRTEKTVVTIADTREALDRFLVRPVRGECVLLVEDAEVLNDESMNALLKTLEEPPPYGIVIIVTARLSHLTPTVLSRCRTIRFGPLATADVVDWLIKERKADAARAKAVAALADGSLSRAEALASAWDEWNPGAEPWARAMDVGELLEMLENDAKDDALERLRSREGARWTLTLWGAAARAALRRRAGLDYRDAAPWLAASHVDRLAGFDPERLVAILDDIADKQVRIDHHGNVHLVLTHLGLRLR